MPIFDIGHCRAAELCRGCSAAGVTAPHLTPPGLWAKMEQPPEKTVVGYSMERCCSVGDCCTCTRQI